MTREEEIKERVDTCGVYYVYDGSVVGTGEAEDDLRYLLARNEELQRRVEKMGRVCRSIWDNASGDVTGKMIVKGSAMMKLLDILDAKEQDDENNR